MPRPIPPKLRKKLLRLISARTDLEASSAAAHFFHFNTSEPYQYQCMLTMVVSYCRPFTENDGIGSLLCEYPSYPDFGDAEMNLRHQRMMDLRHRFLSHSSVEGLQVQLLSPGVTHPFTGEIVTRWFPVIEKRQFHNPHYIVWLSEIIAPLARRLDSDIAKLCAELGLRHVGIGNTMKIDTGSDSFQWSVPQSPPS
jgi:hypothetical protein